LPKRTLKVIAELDSGNDADWRRIRDVLAAVPNVSSVQLYDPQITRISLITREDTDGLGVSIVTADTDGIEMLTLFADEQFPTAERMMQELGEYIARIGQGQHVVDALHAKHYDPRRNTLSGESKQTQPICAYYVGIGSYPDHLLRVEAVNPRQAALLAASGGAPLRADVTIPWGVKQQVRVYELLDVDTGELSEPHHYEPSLRVDTPAPRPEGMTP